MDKSDDEAVRRRALGKIARTLGVSLDTFIPVCPDDQTRPTAEDEAELLALFRQIGDAQTRRRCLDFIRTLTKPSNAR